MPEGDADGGERAGNAVRRGWDTGREMARESRGGWLRGWWMARTADRLKVNMGIKSRGCLRFAVYVGGRFLSFTVKVSGSRN